MTDSEAAPPFTQNYDLSGLSRGEDEVTIVVAPDDLPKLAQWLGVAAVEALTATVELCKHSATRFSLDADLVADLVQDCVVTLEPVRSRIALPVHRELHLAERVRVNHHESIPLGPGAGDDDVPEEIENLTYDLAAPLLEELLLAIDPYPRATGVEFAAPAVEAEPKRENPFAVLKSLKDRG
jgi:uncharacterized metal-binding protein YceD (DUF177 family)